MSHEDLILSLTPAPAARPTHVVGIHRDHDGWWTAWSEPVVFLALIERRIYSQSVVDLPGNPREQRQFLTDTERALEPVIYDGSAAGGFSTLSELEDAGDHILGVVPSDVDWETVVQLIQFAERHLLWRASGRERVGA